MEPRKGDNDDSDYLDPDWKGIETSRDAYRAKYGKEPPDDYPPVSGWFTDDLGNEIWKPVTGKGKIEMIIFYRDDGSEEEEE